MRKADIVGLFKLCQWSIEGVYKSIYAILHITCLLGRLYKLQNYGHGCVISLSLKQTS